jgi:hypothetical protein
VIDPSGQIRIPVISKLEVFDNAENMSFISGGGAMQMFLYATMKGNHSFQALTDTLPHRSNTRRPNDDLYNKTEGCLRNRGLTPAFGN